MEKILILIFIMSSVIIFWAMIGYPLFLIIINKIWHKPCLKKSFEYKPTVTVMVVAHNEEKVIEEKLKNLISLDYPVNKFKIIVTSDCSTDNTNIIVKDFITKHQNYNIKLHKTVNHSGKTNAQNEAQKLIDSEILVMTDANCIFEKEAINELVSVLSESKIAYVCGSTVVINSETDLTANMEALYWDLDSRCRDIESRFSTITAGDGNIYACRNCLYEDIPLIECHDSSFPVLFALKGYRCVYNPYAISYEKAGENCYDEYKRKVRMNRNILHNILPDIRILNIFKYKWFSFFWIGHRTCRYLLWISHALLLLTSVMLSGESVLFMLLFLSQILFFMIALSGHKCNLDNKIIQLIVYYSMTVLSQWHGVYNVITNKARSTWTKAESTR